MTDTLPLDTHIALWLNGGDVRLRPASSHQRAIMAPTRPSQSIG
jgi:hypothetical protein